MSGHANALAQSVTDRKKQIGAQLVETATAIQDALLSAGEVLFSLDKSLSWMSSCSGMLEVEDARRVAAAVPGVETVNLDELVSPARL
jgi:hypothetical protein